MGNRYQYIYSISVFCGVLITAYMMVLKQDNDRMPIKALYSPVLRQEASMLTPGMSSLFQMEKAISSHRENRKVEPMSPEMDAALGKQTKEIPYMQPPSIPPIIFER